MKCTKYSKVNDEWAILECAESEAYPADWFLEDETCFQNQCDMNDASVCQINRCVNADNEMTFCELFADFGWI